jgi:ribonuclease P protein component
VAARQKRRRLSRSAEFDRVYRQGRSVSSRSLVLYAFPREGEPAPGEPGSDEESPRLGVSAGRRVGGAVVRNRVKRSLREAFWALDDKVPERHDFVIVARAEAKALVEGEGATGVQRELEQLLAQLSPEPAAGEGG